MLAKSSLYEVSEEGDVFIFPITGVWDLGMIEFWKFDLLSFQNVLFYVFGSPIATTFFISKFSFF